VLLAGLVISAAPQAPDARLEAQLRTLFPWAASFSEKEATPPHYTVYVMNSGQQAVAGYAFWTTDVVPRERGFDGPIQVLVGMDMSGFLTGIIVGAHHEPFGPRSIDRPQFPAQFRGKSIRDPFRVGSDIDWVSRATISVTSVSRAVRDGARIVADNLLPPGAGRP
jgi:transcriptional regulator of nitric oxide reductase